MARIPKLVLSYDPHHKESNIPTTRYKHLGNNHPKISPAHVEIYLAEFVVQLLTLGSQGVRSAIDILVHHTPCITS